MNDKLTKEELQLLLNIYNNQWNLLCNVKSDQSIYFSHPKIRNLLDLALSLLKQRMPYGIERRETLKNIKQINSNLLWIDRLISNSRVNDTKEYSPFLYFLTEKQDYIKVVLKRTQKLIKNLYYDKKNN